MSMSLKNVIRKYGYDDGYKKYIIDHPSSVNRIQKSIEKYGFKNGIDKIIEENTQKYSNTKERFIKLYGEEEGSLRWEKFIKPREKTNIVKRAKPTIENFIEKYGKEGGKKLWDKYKKSLGYTKKKCIEKYGKEEGEKKWNEYIDKMSKSCKKSTSSEIMKYINSKEFYVEKYGKEEGEKKYFLWKKSQDHSSKEFMIKKYGIKDGLKKYKEIGLKKAVRYSAYHSKISQTLFEEIRKIIKDDLNIRYSNNGGELMLYNENEKKPYYYDFSYKKKIIEYNGDFWHANPKIYESNYNFNNEICASDVWERDKKKIDFAKKLGYDVFIVWDNEYKKDKIGILEKCLNFLKK